tara:strand:- start:167 stop:580 length:414 start_codon:yes stop_codon:yes gene_type:complete
MTARYDWTINQGETSNLTYVRAVSGAAADALYNGTTLYANFRMQVKDKYGGTSSLSISGDGTAIPFLKNPDSLSGGGNAADSLNHGNSTVKITITAAETAAIAAGKYVYDVENHNGSGVVERILEGSLIVKPEVTTV